MDKEVEEKFREMTNIISDMANKLTILEFLVENPSRLLVKGNKEVGYKLYYFRNGNIKCKNIPNSESADRVLLSYYNQILVDTPEQQYQYQFNVEHEFFTLIKSCKKPNTEENS